MYTYIDSEIDVWIDIHADTHTQIATQKISECHRHALCEGAVYILSPGFQEEGNGCAFPGAGREKKVLDFMLRIGKVLLCEVYT